MDVVSHPAAAAVITGARALVTGVCGGAPSVDALLAPLRGAVIALPVAACSAVAIKLGGPEDSFVTTSSMFP